MKLPYVLRRNTSSNPRMSGKYYGRVWEKNLLDTRGLADHMVEHGIVRNNSKVYTILSKLQLRDRTQVAIWAVQTGTANRPLSR